MFKAQNWRRFSYGDHGIAGMTFRAELKFHLCFGCHKDIAAMALWICWPKCEIPD